MIESANTSPPGLGARSAWADARIACSNNSVASAVEHGARYRAFVPGTPPGGAYRAVHVFAKSQTSRERIRRLQHLDEHSGITSLPRIDEYHERGREIYVVMPWVRGHTLREHLDGARRAANNDHKSISVSGAIKLFTGFAHALAHLHRHLNVVHGDLKPENLIVHPRPNRLVMIDFGSAWLVQRTTRRGDLDGLDEHYAALELQAGEFADFRSDLFSASAILYEMLTLKRPYDGVGGKAGLDRFKAEYANSYIAAPRARARGFRIRIGAFPRRNPQAARGIRPHPVRDRRAVYPGNRGWRARRMRRNRSSSANASCGCSSSFSLLPVKTELKST